MKKRDLRTAKIKKMLKNFKLETAVKTELANTIENVIVENQGAEFLERFQSILSKSQLQTLIEIIYNCGSARIENGNIDQIVIFKGDLEKMKYNLSRTSLSKGHHRASIENQEEEVESYVLIDLNELDSDKWKLSLNYTDFIKKEY